MKKHVHQAFRLLQVAHPRWGAQFVDPELIEMWGSLVEDIPEASLIPAVKRLARGSKWAPSVAEIREAAGLATADAWKLTGFAKKRAEALAGHRGERAKQLAIENEDPMEWYYAMEGI